MKEIKENAIYFKEDVIDLLSIEKRRRNNNKTRNNSKQFVCK